ncbi:hypothetical protein POKO110462_05640 [Pontibacter korlensis]|uniref:STAS/SEC14 domain-containing protein n=1 Tax=Pontibacter korlensis TaxID=400092 RepID=A0A0E3ZGJ5_9BACT|nr:hypothetical protein [Pontibacter korlensis]AKD03430.1 hypothetical protein PKOR_10210 [Pontibacter korlensis]
MKLHSDGLCELEYDAATDILTARWLQSKTSTLAELSYTMQVLLDTIRNYDIKRLLIDAHEDVEGVSDVEYVDLNVEFAKKLVQTRLQKIARLGNPNHNRENFIEALAEDLLAQPTTLVAFQNFTDERSAIQWLLHD